MTRGELCNDVQSMLVLGQAPKVDLGETELQLHHRKQVLDLARFFIRSISSTMLWYRYTGSAAS